MKALIIGGMGMVGRQLTKLCSKEYDEVCVLDIDYKTPKDLPQGVKYHQADLTFKSNASVVADFDHIYHLAGKKGSPDTAKNSPADYLPMLQFDTNVIEAVGHYKPDWFLYTSSVGVYPPMEVYEEDKVWYDVPSVNDKVPGYIKRMGELSCYAIRATYMVKNKVNNTVNLGSGEGVKISDIANTIGNFFDKEVKYDTTKPNGDMKRLMSMRRAQGYGFNPSVKLKDGINMTIEWYLNGI